MRLALAVLLVCFSAVAAADATTYTCSFKRYSDEKGVHMNSEPLTLTFIVDAQAKRSYMLGNNGAAPVQSTWDRNGGLTLIETTPSGTVQVTVVSSSLEAVHSRHTRSREHFSASQSYGTCTVK